MNALDKPNETIQQLLTEKTMSLEALPHIQNLKDTVTALEAKLRHTEEIVKSRDTTINNLQSDYDVLRKERDVLKAAETAMADREARVFELEKTAAVATAFKEAYRDAMAIVFAPNAMRQRVVASSGNMSNNQYTTYNEDSSRTTLEGYQQPVSAGERGQVMDRTGSPTSL